MWQLFATTGLTLSIINSKELLALVSSIKYNPLRKYHSACKNTIRLMTAMLSFSQIFQSISVNHLINHTSHWFYMGIWFLKSTACLFNSLFRLFTRECQTFVLLAFRMWNPCWPMNSPHIKPLMRNVFPCRDVIVNIWFQIGHFTILMKPTDPSFSTHRMWHCVHLLCVRQGGNHLICHRLKWNTFCTCAL